MKIKLLFVIESLNLGGAEKSLVTLLNLIDYNQYEVDLQLFAYNGPFQNLLPKEVNLLPALDYFDYCNIPYRSIIRKFKNVTYLKSQISYSLKLRTKSFNNIEKAVIMWKETNKCFKVNSKEYDVAIAYAQGMPTFYVADKIIAKKKIAWVNVTYKPTGNFLKYISSYFDKYHHINAVSVSVYNQMVETFKINSAKCNVVRDIYDYDFNKKMAGLECVIFDKSPINLLTVGRLVNQKGYDLAVEAARILKERNVSFKWYVIGEGNQRSFIESKIEEYQLEDYFILLGAKSNPYPYFEACDLYVQTSKFEGFGITLAEARMFNKPIVTTEFDAVYSQMIPDVNGIVVPINPKGIADGIEKLINNPQLRNDLIEYLKTEKKGNLEELEKFYELINS